MMSFCSRPQLTNPRRYAGGVPREARDLKLFAMTKGVAPDTKWCGKGDIARDYRELGLNYRVDKCCRVHDHCPQKIKTGWVRDGLENKRPYTM